MMGARVTTCGMSGQMPCQGVRVGVLVPPGDGISARDGRSKNSEA